ncbi:B-cell receptor CD22-like [Acanthochromis polyacanthus]|uniref:B-cell receptor CD22-like n=1 Tax=Acanthochromis polyacanthus TaxID=80966 RepID=UPI002233FC48|nr:B-cell receptor CD22-like [Acanthochromis polyacanthus]
MGCKAAQAGFLVFLLSSSVVQGDAGYRVRYSSTQICALQGSEVDISCTYTYPSRVKENVTVVEEAVWFTKMNRDEPVDLMTDSEFADRVQYRCDKNSCTLKITDLRISDSAEYKFMFRTNQPGQKTIGSPGVTLSVTALQVKVTETWLLYPSWAELTCSSSCRLPDHYSYLWYMNGKTLHTKTSSIEKSFDYSVSIACAVKRYEKLPSPSLCVHESPCNSVVYTQRSICIPKGSSVDISCTYSHKTSVLTTFWFSPERSRQPEDLKEDSQYEGRVEVVDKRGRSTLRIRDLRVTDSAQYQFKFIARRFEWKSNLPGTTLTVTALQVQVTRIISVHQSQTEAELKCHSSCSPADRLSYIWFKNGQKISKQQTSTYTGSFNPGEKISCAFKGHEDHRSPTVYPSKLPSVSVSPSGELVEGSSVTLTCRTDANPAAENTLYKGNQSLPLGSEGTYHFTSISSEDRGLYDCKSDDQSVSLFINVLYAPKLPSVSVSPSGEIMEGSSVNLTCSSDANPAATYTWYKENEDSPLHSGQTFTMTDFRAEHSGNYYCEAQNMRGCHNSTFYLNVASRSWKFPITLSITAVILAFILLFLLLWIRSHRSVKQQPQAGEGPDSRTEMDEIQYASVQFTANQPDAVYSNFSPGQMDRYQEESVVYSTTKPNRSTRTRNQAAVEDPSALYSKVVRK